MHTRALAVLLVALALALPTYAYGGPAEDRRAAELFRQSANAYREGRFQDAVDLLLEARQAKAEAVLLYDLGRAYEGLGKPAEAAEAYAHFLEEAPNARDSKAIEARIATLRRQADDLKRTDEARAAPAQPPLAPALPAPLPPSQPPKEGGSDKASPIPWVVGGFGLAALGTGILFGAIARSGYDDASSDPVQTSAAERYDAAKRDAVIANVALAAGAILIVTAAVWLGVRAAAKTRSGPSPTAF